VALYTLKAGVPFDPAIEAFEDDGRAVDENG
jgi:hypothetical protein